jgi:hypothetical protein
VPYFVVERYWPGVTAADVAALADQLRRADDPRTARAVRYLGSTLLVDDDVVQCRFVGTDVEAVRLANDDAGIRYDRILQALAYPPWVPPNRAPSWARDPTPSLR